jgi:diaminopimelate decarboxylase
LDAVGRRLGKPAPFSLRVNPDVDARTHPYIATGLKTSKFGVPFAEAVALYHRARRMTGVRAVGLDCHIGSQLTELGPVREAVGKVAALFRDLNAQGLGLTLLDVGGGIGIRYTHERPPTLEAWARAVLQPLRGLGATLVLEPGRVIVGNAALLLTRVLYMKRAPYKSFAIVDAGMNDLLRPALYEAHHDIVPVRPRRGRHTLLDVVGPVCESADVLGAARRLPPLDEGDLLAVMTAGAYGMSMSSNYNSRPRPPEVLVDGRNFQVVRRRESVEDLWNGES